MSCIYTYRKSFSRNSLNIAPLGFRTGDMEWRNKLKEGDQIDTIDQDLKWYRGTVLQTKKFQAKNKELLDVRVGFRVYVENGMKEDNKHRKYEGWSELYDEWLLSSSLRIQKPGLISKEGTVYCKKNLDIEYFVPEDSSDMLLYVKKQIKFNRIL